MSPSSFEIHPISVKLLRQGHPWVTLDQYSKRFSPDSLFIRATDKQHRFVAILLHDKYHKNIKARLWSRDPEWKESTFINELESRIKLAFEKRRSIPEFRENIYWIFGEADQLPGLFLLQLKDQWIFQTYSSYWLNFKEKLIKIVTNEIAPTASARFWWQDRGIQKPPQSVQSKNEKIEFNLDEMGVKYQIRLGENYDYGIYTDMANIRERLPSTLMENKSVLNLYCYTGAFSLWALKNKAQQVFSVDLSSKYLQWLETNLKLNPGFSGSHHSLEGSVLEILKNWDKNKMIDFIICDPPSFSSDGVKKTSALKSYEELFPQFDKILNKGGYVLTFLNTHTVSWEKYLAQIKKMTHFKLTETFDLGGDCGFLPHFPEGRYLKGILWKKI